MSYAEFEMKVIQWGEKRGIVQNSTPLAQAIKTQEELDEFVKEIQKVFESMTPEELEEQAVEIDIEEIVEAMENDPEAVELMKQIAMDERKLH